MEPISASFTMDIRRFRILRELRDRGTIAAVADALHLTPSAVSQQIAKLSREVGVPLIARQGRRVRLTDQAYLLLEHAEAIQRQIEHARADLTAHSAGSLGRVSVGGFASAISGLVAPVLPELGRRFPGIQVMVREVEPPECFALLEAGDIDIVITVDHRDGPTRNDPRYHRIDLLFDPLVMALPDEHPLARREAVALTDFADAPWIVGADKGSCSDAGYAACAMAGFTPDVRHRVNEWTAAVALVGGGAGVALVPRLAVGDPPPGVALRPLTHPPAGRTLYAALREGAQGTPTYVAVLEALRGQARRAVAGDPADALLRAARSRNGREPAEVAESLARNGVTERV